jgi:hypothetical protein
MLPNLVEMLITRLSSQSAREDCLELRQEASDLQEYSSAKIERVTRYLGVLAERARRLGDYFLPSSSAQVSSHDVTLVRFKLALL